MYGLHLSTFGQPPLQWVDFSSEPELPGIPTQQSQAPSKLAALSGWMASHKNGVSKKQGEHFGTSKIGHVGYVGHVGPFTF